MFPTQKTWASWLEKHHRSSPGVWLRLAKKKSDLRSLTYDEAVEAALCYGWIDGQKRSDDERAWLQKFTPRGKRSIWSKLNREKALALIERGAMKRPGLDEIERAKQDGRWESAYDSPSRSTVPDDLQAALDENARAQAFFTSLDKANRYAILFRVHTAKKAETRAKRIEQFVAMLARHEKLHP